MRSLSVLLLLGVAVLASGVAARSVAHTAHAVAPAPAPECGFGGISVQSLVGRELVGTVTSGSNEYSYYVSVCGVLEGQPSCLAQDNLASVCEIDPQGNAIDLGNWVVPGGAFPPAWSYNNGVDNSEGVMYTAVGTPTCQWSSEPQNFMTNVRFVCGAIPAPKVTVQVDEQMPCYTNVTITTVLACVFEDTAPAALALQQQLTAEPEPEQAAAVECGFGGFDLSPLVGKDLVGTISANPDTAQLYVSVCGVLSNQQCLEQGESSSVCAVWAEPQFGGQVENLGNWTSPAPAFSFINGEDNADGIQYTTSGAWTCEVEGNDPPYTWAPWTTNIMFQCGGEGPEPTIAMVGPPSFGCTMNVTVITTLVC